MALVGRIARAYGLKGQVIVNLDTDFPEERFQPGAELFVERGGNVAPLTVTTVRFHRERPVIGLRGIESIADAAPLAGLELRVPLEALAALPQGAFYRHDLIGCRVETTAGGAVGIVSDVEGSATGSRLVIDGTGGGILGSPGAGGCFEREPVGKGILFDPPDGVVEMKVK